MDDLTPEEQRTQARTRLCLHLAVIAVLALCAAGVIAFGS